MTPPPRATLATVATLEVVNLMYFLMEGSKSGTFKNPVVFSTNCHSISATSITHNRNNATQISHPVINWVCLLTASLSNIIIITILHRYYHSPSSLQGVTLVNSDKAWYCPAESKKKDSPAPLTFIYPKQSETRDKMIRRPLQTSLFMVHLVDSVVSSFLLSTTYICIIIWLFSSFIVVYSGFNFRLKRQKSWGYLTPPSSISG